MTSQRLTDALADLAKCNTKALVSFIMAGDPDGIETSAYFISALIAGGSDIVEIGMPFSDPAADGVAIQAAGQRALAQNISTQDIFALVRAVRAEHSATPLVLMGYYNSVFRMGEVEFIKQAADAGADALIIVDLPYEMAESLTATAKQSHLSFVPLIAPNSSAERMQTTLDDADGFLYAIAIKGITGSSAPDLAQVQAQIATIRSVSNLPIMLGFGIREPAQAHTLSQYVDGVVVGSAYCDTIAHHAGDMDAIAQALHAQARSIKNAIASS